MNKRGPITLNNKKSEYQSPKSGSPHGQISITVNPASLLTSKEKNYIGTPDSYRERAMTWSTTPRDRVTNSVDTLRSNSVVDMQFAKDVNTKDNTIKPKTQEVRLSLTNCDIDTPQHRTSSTPRHSLKTTSNSGFLTPRINSQTGKDKSRSRANSRMSIVSDDDNCSLLSSQSSLRPGTLGPPKSAWDQFSDYIKEIDDSSYYFNQHHRFYKASDTFKQCCSGLNYKLPMDNERKESLDIESVLNMSIPVGFYDPRVSIASTAIDKGKEEIILDLSSNRQDFKSRSQTPSVLSVCKERTDENDKEDSEDSDSSDDRAILSPWVEDDLEYMENRRKKGRKKSMRPVSAILEEKEPEARQELYQRYLHNPDTWTVGLQKYLKKSTVREKTNKISTTLNSYPQAVYRPKALMFGEKAANNLTKKRVLSANYPTTTTGRLKSRATSARSTMSHIRIPPSMV